MLIDSMTGAQLNAEYHKDLPELQEQARKLDASAHIDKVLKRNAKADRVVMSRYMTTSRHNRYLCIVIYIPLGKKRGVRAWTWQSFHIGIMNTDKGIMAIAIYDDIGQSIIYTPHFLRRYQERYSKVSDWQVRNKLQNTEDLEDIIATYISRNPVSAWVNTKTEFYNRIHIFSPVNDGVALLQWDRKRKILQANTFVTYDMLNERQIGMVKDAITYLSQNQKENAEKTFPDFIEGD